MTEARNAREAYEKQCVTEIVHARYVSDVKKGLEGYFKTIGTDALAVQRLRLGIHTSITTPLSLEGYTIPPAIAANNEKVRRALQQDFNDLPPSPTAAEMQDFIIAEHERIKQAQNRWLIANPGVMLEIVKLPTDAHATLRTWLHETYGIEPGHELIHRHVISESGRDRLEAAGVTVPHKNWGKEYIVDGLYKAAALVKSNPVNKGIIGMGSWIYNPDNHSLAPDGKPFVAFDFLADDRLTGKRIYLGEATATNDFVTQYSFATRNPRRNQFVQDGLFQPKVFGVFYPRDELLRQFSVN